MAEARENKVSGLGEAWNSKEFMQECMSIWRRMTGDDIRRLNDQLRQMEEQKTGLFAPWKERSDNAISDDKKRAKELRGQTEEGKQESKIVENGSHEIKSDNGDTIENVAIESDTWNDSGGSNDDTFTENSASLSAVNIKNKVGEVNQVKIRKREIQMILFE